MILHPLQVYLRIQVSFLSNFGKILEGQALPDQQELVVQGLVEQSLLDQLDWVVLVLVVVEAAQEYFDQLEWDLKLSFGLQNLGLDFELQDLELDLQDLASCPQIDFEH